MDGPRFAYQVIHCWTFGWFGDLGHLEQSSHIRECQGSSLSGTFVQSSLKIKEVLAALPAVDSIPQGSERMRQKVGATSDAAPASQIHTWEPGP